jgi:hypothetical protein
LKRRLRQHRFLDCKLLRFDFFLDLCSYIFRYTLKEWCEDMVKAAEAGKLRSGPKDNFWDKVFENEMNELTQATRENYES